MNEKWKKTKTEKNKGDGRYRKRVRAKWFCCAFKLGFLQLICKTSFIFKSNLELALSIILKERELYESKHVGSIRNSLSVNCRMFHMKMLHRFVKDSFVVPSISVIKELQHVLKELSISENLSSKQLISNLQYRTAINRYRNRYIYSTKKIFFTDEGF